MDLNYNIMKLDELIDSIIKDTLEKNGKNSVKKLIDAIINEKEIDEEKRKLLNNYSSDTLRLSLEKKILLSIENKALANRKSYWEVLKSRAPRIKSGILSHYYDNYIMDLTNKNIKKYEARTINELNEVYDTEIKQNLNVFSDNVNSMVDELSNVTLNHMENLNSNGRVININGKKKGGIFLDKNSKIGYGKFVNKEEFLNLLNNLKDAPNNLKTNQVSIKELKVIVENVNSCLNINQNENSKRSDVKTITLGQAGMKKAGNLFLGKETQLPDGSYVSMEEINLAVTKYVNEKNKSNEKPKTNKVINIKGKVKQFAAIAAMAITVLSTSIPSIKKNPLSNSVAIVQEVNENENDYLENAQEIIVNEKEKAEIPVITLEKTESVESVVLDNNINSEVNLSSNNPLEIEPIVEVQNPIIDEQIEETAIINDEITENNNLNSELSTESSELEINEKNNNEISDRSLEDIEIVEQPIEDSIDEESTEVEPVIYQSLVPTHQAKPYFLDDEVKNMLYATAQHEAGGTPFGVEKSGYEPLYNGESTFEERHYTDAMAVVSTVLNRLDDQVWVDYSGDTVEKQLKKSGQYINPAVLAELSYYKNPELISPEIKQAVDDCLSGIRNTDKTSYKGQGCESSEKTKLVAGGNNFHQDIRIPIVENQENTLFMSDAELIAYEAARQDSISEINKVR